MSQYQYHPHNLHRLEQGAQSLLFHPPTLALFQSDPAMERQLQQLGQFNAGEWIQQDQLDKELIDDLRALRILTAKGEPVDSSDRVQQLLLDSGEFPLSTLILNVNTGCNLSCTYCYKEDLEDAKNGLKMDVGTAFAAVDLLMRENPGDSPVNIVFFGGEPLTHLPLIKSVIDYAEREGDQRSKPVNFSMTTNATMLTPSIMDYLDTHRVGLTISMDGPQAIHDKNRITSTGNGTYAVVRRKVEQLLSRYRSRPVGARVTLTRGVTDVVGIHRHLKEELGFFEVGFAPVTAGDVANYNLPPEQLAQVFGEMRQLGERYVEQAIAGGNIGFGNLHQLISNLHNGSSKALPCAAGLSLLAVDGNGELNLCHRFTGSALPTFGNVSAGVDKSALRQLLSNALDKSDRGCSTCSIRNLCAGGCYHESYTTDGDLFSPTWQYCDLLRDWTDFGIRAYHRILDQSPDYLEQHIIQGVNP